jgi:DNA-binding XRE family transcriptional regulator
MTKQLVHEQPNEPLVNYLRAHRRKSGLTQSDLARVLGYDNYGSVSRHERFAAVPSLLMALRYQFLFREPVSQIFAGLNESVEFDLEIKLAEFESYLGTQSARGPRAAAIARKLEWLSERRRLRVEVDA